MNRTRISFDPDVLAQQELARNRAYALNVAPNLGQPVIAAPMLPTILSHPLFAPPTTGHTRSLPHPTHTSSATTVPGSTSAAPVSNPMFVSTGPARASIYNGVLARSRPPAAPVAPADPVAPVAPAALSPVAAKIKAASSMVGNELERLRSHKAPK